MSTLSRQEHKRLVKERYLSRRDARDGKFNVLKDIIDDAHHETLPPTYRDYVKVCCDEYCDICIDNMLVEINGDDSDILILHECPISEKFKKKHGIYPDIFSDIKNTFKSYYHNKLTCICDYKNACDRASKKIFSTIKKDTDVRTKSKCREIVYETRNTIKDFYVYRKYKVIRCYDPRTCTFSKRIESSPIYQKTFSCAYCLSKYVPDLRIVDVRRVHLY